MRYGTGEQGQALNYLPDGAAYFGSIADATFHAFDGRWHHLTLTYAPKLANAAGIAPELGMFYLKIDDVWVAEAVASGHQPTVPASDGDANANRTVVIGNGVDLGEIAPFEGWIDDVKIWSLDRSPSLMTATVDRDSGELKLEGGEFAREIFYYEVNSPSGAIEADAWLSLDEQGFDAGDPPTPAGVEIHSSPMQLAEVFAGGTSWFRDTTSVSLGAVFNGAAEDLDIIVTLADTLAEISLPVIYFDGSVIVELPGDYNGNGVVDAPDYIVWRDTFGSDGPDRRADGNENGRVDAPDYVIWRDNFGDQRGAQVPEPSGIAIVVGVLAILGYPRVRLAAARTRC